MKLSEAIRAGAKLGPQAFGALSRRPWYAVFWPFARTKMVCALGGAFEIGGCETKEVPKTQAAPFRGKDNPSVTVSRVVQTPDKWTRVFHMQAECPQYCGVTDTVYRIIPHLNDGHRWKREEIAAWVEKIEDAALVANNGEIVNGIRAEINPDEEWPAEITLASNSERSSEK